MQHKFIKHFISVLVLTVTVFNGIALTNVKAYAVTPQQVNDAVDKFSSAIGKFAAKDASENIGKIANFCNRLGGITSVASGVIGVLQMTGIIKDPTVQMLGQILDAVKDVQTTLDNMNHTLNQIAQDLINIQIAQQEISRNNNATTMSTNWNNFNTNYTEKLANYVVAYQAKINSGIQAWWNQTSHDGVYVLMTKKYTEEGALTYSKQNYSAGLPATSDINNETVNKEWSIGIPSAYMPNTSATTFNVDTYRNDFKNLMITALENAITANALDSNCGASVKSEYNGSSKQAMLESYAENVLNTVIYKISCQVMTENNSWVAEVLSNYTHYCDNILQRDSGINAFLNYIYLTHAFEGEVKDDITNFLDAMIAQVGFYGEFALTCAGQDSLQTTDTKTQIRDYFVNTVLSINNRKSKAITGYDNYCYITGTILQASTPKISYSMNIHLSAKGLTYDGCDVNNWSLENISTIVDSVYLPIIYKQYTKLPQGTNSFGEYLHKYGAQGDTDNKIYMTNYRGAEDFSFGEGIYMKATKYVGDYFSDGSWYHIDVGTGSKVEQQYYHCHDKVMADLFDCSNGNPPSNTMLAARALYGESHWYWGFDEAWAFHTEPSGVDFAAWDSGKVTCYFFVDTLSSQVYHGSVITAGRTSDISSIASLNLDIDSSDIENPFYAFECVTLTPGISDNDTPHYVNLSKDITDVLLESDSFTYTGDPIEPAVTVLCSDDIVPEDGYTVTYINNTESGDHAVVRVQGVGDYSGTITRHFMISSSNYAGSGSGGCNAISGLGAVLGLVFVIKRFRRH